MKLSTFFTSCVKKAAVAAVLLPLAGNAQYLRSTYFMEGAQYRLQLNPALAPSRGFVHLPAISNSSAWIRSNSIGMDDVFDIIDNSDDADYFTSDKFLGNLEDRNHAIANLATDMFAVGWWRGENFWSLNWGVKADGFLNVPRELFTFMRDMKGNRAIDYANYHCDMSDQELNLNIYNEIGVGWARTFNDRWSVGVRLKGLLGLGNLNLKVNRAVVRTNLQGVDPDIDWGHIDYEQLKDAQGTASIAASATLESSFKGLELLTNEEGYIDDVDFKTKNADVSGMGAAIDAGVACRVAGGLTLSAAVTDLGFIKWSKSSTLTAHSQYGEQNFDTSNPEDLERLADVLGSNQALNYSLLRMALDDGENSKSRTTHLRSTLALGAEYAFMDDKLSVGALYTDYMGTLKSESEVTLSVNYRPSSLVGITASYSPVVAEGKSVGVAVKLGPLFVGTDYIYTGKGTNCCNALFGLSIPLGKKQQQ